MRSQSTGRLVVLVGIDGCGKTTILNHLASRGHHVSSWKYLSSVPNNRSPRLTKTTLEYIRGLPFGDYVNDLQPFSRASFVLSLIFAEYEYIIKPLLDAGSDVITDTYYIRPLAKEVMRKKANKAVVMAASHLPPPDLVVKFQLDPKEAYR